MVKITKTTHILFIVLVVVAIYANSLKSDFVWDDLFLIVDNPYIKNWHNTDVVFSGQIYYGANKSSNYYRPLQLVSYAIDHSLWNLNPAGYHLTNLCLHTLNSILVYIFIIAVFGSSGIALLTALFFASAPVISSATYYISSRADLLVTLFIFASILSFIRYRRDRKPWAYILSLSCFLLALLSRESAIVLPFLLVLVFFQISPGKDFKEVFKCMFLFFLLLAVYILARATVFNFINDGTGFIVPNHIAQIPFLNRMLTNFKVIVIYLGLLIFPFNLRMNRDIEPAGSMFQWDILFSIAIIFLAALALKRLSRNDPRIRFGIFWFFIALFPLLNFYPLSVFLHETWLYLPSVGFYFLISILILEVVYRKTGRMVAGGVIAVFLSYFIVLSLLNGSVWRDEIAVFRNAVKYSPEDPCLHSSLALAYFNSGSREEGIRECRYSVELRPEFSGGYNNLGLFYARQGDHVRAMKNFKKSIKVNPQNAAPHLNIGITYNKLGHYQKALKAMNRCIELSPDYYKPYCALGLVYFNLNQYNEAKSVFNKALTLNRDSYEAHYYLGNIYLETGDMGRALEQYEVCMCLDENNAEFYNKLASLYVKTKRYAEAEKAFMRAKEMDEGYFPSYNNLGNLYSALGMFDLAILEYEKALSLEPDNPGIRFNLVKTYEDLREDTQNR